MRKVVLLHFTRANIVGRTMSKFVGIDVGSKMGIAIGEMPYKITNVSEVDLNAITNNGTRSEKLRAFSAVYLGLLEHNPEISKVAFEIPFCHGTHATRLLLGMTGMIESITPPLITLAEIRPTSLKKFATGKGRASKQEMIAEAEHYIKRPGQPLTDNEADAIHICRWAMMENKE